MRLAAACLAVLLATSGAAWAQTTTPSPGPGKSAPPPTVTTPSTSMAPAATATPGAHATAATPSAASAADEAAAKAKCGTDTVVWGNPGTKVYHTSDSRYFGKTKHGSFMCMKDAVAEGYHAPKHATHAKKHTAS